MDLLLWASVLYSGSWKDSVKKWLIWGNLVEFIGSFAVSPEAQETSCSQGWYSWSYPFASGVKYSLLYYLFFQAPHLSSPRPTDTSELPTCHVQLWETWTESTVFLNKYAFYHACGWKWFWINVWLLKLCTFPWPVLRKQATSTEIRRCLHFSLDVSSSPPPLNVAPKVWSGVESLDACIPLCASISLSRSLSNYLWAGFSPCISTFSYIILMAHGKAESSMNLENFFSLPRLFWPLRLFLQLVAHKFFFDRENLNVGSLFLFTFCTFQA